MTSFSCHSSRVGHTPLFDGFLEIPRKNMLPKAMGAAYRGRFHFVAALYHIFGQNQSVMALQNCRTSNYLMLVNAEK
jgi:hypothetical protein